jgi:hypothetical protein
VAEQRPRCRAKRRQAGQSEWTKVHWAGDILATRVKVSAEHRWARGRADVDRHVKRRHTMGNIFYIIGVVVVVAVILGYFGFR